MSLQYNSIKSFPIPFTKNCFSHLLHQNKIIWIKNLGIVIVEFIILTKRIDESQQFIFWQFLNKLFYLEDPFHFFLNRKIIVKHFLVYCITVHHTIQKIGFLNYRFNTKKQPPRSFLWISCSCMAESLVNKKEVQLEIQLQSLRLQVCDFAQKVLFHHRSLNHPGKLCSTVLTDCMNPSSSANKMITWLTK